MKKLSLLILSGLTLFIISGCSTTPEKKKAKAEKQAKEQAEKEAFFEDGGMENQVQSWKSSGGRY